MQEHCTDDLDFLTVDGSHIEADRDEVLVGHPEVVEYVETGEAALATGVRNGLNF